MHALEGLQVYYNNSREGDIYHTVVGIILANIHNISDYTIYDFADMCFVSPTTISRLSKKLGYTGFQAFKNSLVNTVKNYDVLNQYMSFNDRARYDNSVTAYLEMQKKQVTTLEASVDIEQLDHLVQVIHSCKKVNFYTNGTMFSEYRFQGDLLMAGHMSEIKTSPMTQMKDIPSLTPADMVIMIAPVVQDAVDMSVIIQALKVQAAKLFILTDAEHPSLKKSADYFYSFPGAMGIIDDYRFAMYLNLLSIRFRELILD